MDKNIIKQHLSERFLSEAKDTANTPGITVTNAVTKKSGEENKAGVKAIEKDLTAYSKDVKKDKDMSKMAQNKFNYEDGELEYHDQMEIMNGQEMIEYDRPTSKQFSDRAKESLEGSSRMGNKGGKDMGNAEAMEGVSSDDFGKERLKNAEASAKKRKDQTDNILSFGDVIMELPKGSKPAKVHSAYATNENNDNNKPQIKETMKRLKFNKNGDKPFEGVNLTQKLGHALTLIPESYRVDNKEFEMTDGSVSCKVRWEGTLNEGKAVVLLASDKSMINEDMQKMKHLMGYKSNETLGLVKGKARLDENKMFTDIWSKTKELMEAEDIESVKAKTGNLEDIKKKAPEATKHVQGSVSKDKGTQAPAAKEGDLDDAVSHAPEAKKHVEGSVSTEKGTKAPAPKNGNWEDVKKKSADATKHVTLKESEEKEDEDEEKEDYGTNKVTGEKLPKPEPITEEDEDDDMPEAPSDKDTAANQVTEISDIEGTKASKTAPWEDHNVKHAAEAKKHIMNMSEGVTLGGIKFEPINEGMYEEGVYEEGTEGYANDNGDEESDIVSAYYDTLVGSDSESEGQFYAHCDNETDVVEMILSRLSQVDFNRGAIAATIVYAIKYFKSGERIHHEEEIETNEF
jgi:hypothetical protein